MIFDPLEHPFKQLLWILYNLRKAEIKYDSFSGYNNRQQIKYWRKRADDILTIIGIDENTDFKNMELTIVES